MSKRAWWTVVMAVVVGSAAWWGIASRGHDSSETTAQAAPVASRPEPPASGEGAGLPASAPPLAMPEPTPNSRFQLFRVTMGPAAPAASAAAEAVIAVDGLPPRTYRVGDAVVGAVVLQSVQPSSATLGPAGGPAAVVLGLSAAPTPSDTARQPGTSSPPVIRAASSPPVNRAPVIVTDPNHGVDDTNR